jgi:catechol 2,3-dioxygenase-like lactoylglutathione lyase family enzyme
MRVPSLILIALVAAVCLAGSQPQDSVQAAGEKKQPMQLGAFSVSLTVKDLAASHSFYEKLGFTKTGGDAKQNWLILRNGDTVIGLFQGMFEKNILTFNPGWDQQAKGLEKFTDVRELQSVLESKGIKPVLRADETTDGPASFVLSDPDGNQILFDQHVARKP